MKRLICLALIISLFAGCRQNSESRLQPLARAGNATPSTRLRPVAPQSHAFTPCFIVTILEVTRNITPEPNKSRAGKRDKESTTDYSVYTDERRLFCEI